MTSNQKKTSFTRGERIALILFTVLFGLYMLNVVIGKITIVFGWKAYHIGDVGEFLILLAASIAFIVAALHRETIRNASQGPTPNQGPLKQTGEHHD